MYFPKSQVTTGLYTNGDEYTIQGSGNVYTGPYWETSRGAKFTGEGPSSPNPQRLIPIDQNFSGRPSPANEEQATSYNDDSIVYSTLIRPTSLDFRPRLPINTTPMPTENDYVVGEFRRCFIKKNNETTYGEITPATYNAMIFKDPTLLWQLYYTFSIPWTLVGDQKQVYNTNRRIVELAIHKKKLPKFAEFLKNDYLKYYKG